MNTMLDEWLTEVDHELQITEGVTLDEIGYFDWWLCFNDGESPNSALQIFYSCQEEDG